jgi:hypothetical protein
VSHTEQRPQLRHVQSGPGAVDDRVEDAFHHRAGGEDQVAAVLDLVDRVAVGESTARLLGEVQTEAQAGGVDPSVDDLAQAPYCPGQGQGVCDPSQAFGVTDAGEAVALLGEADARGVGLAGDVRVTSEDHLGTERRMPAHLDRQMPPHRVHDVERVVVDELLPLLQVADHPGGGTTDLPHRRRRSSHQDQEHPRSHRVRGQIVLGDPVLALIGLADDHRHPVHAGPSPHPAGEPASQPDQVRGVGAHRVGLDHPGLPGLGQQRPV